MRSSPDTTVRMLLMMRENHPELRAMTHQPGWFELVLYDGRFT
jgi:hypothetical protein